MEARINIRVRDELKHRLVAQAEIEHMSVTALIVKIVRNYLNEQAKKEETI